MNRPIRCLERNRGADTHRDDPLRHSEDRPVRCVARRRRLRGSIARSSHKSFEQVEAEFFDHIRPTSLIKRFASPQEVAFLVVHVQVHSLRRPWGWPFASTAASSRAPSEGLPGPSVRSLLRTRAFEFVRYSRRCLRAARPAHMKKATSTRGEADRPRSPKSSFSPPCWARRWL